GPGVLPLPVGGERSVCSASSASPSKLMLKRKPSSCPSITLIWSSALSAVHYRGTAVSGGGGDDGSTGGVSAPQRAQYGHHEGLKPARGSPLGRMTRGHLHDAAPRPSNLQQCPHAAPPAEW